MLVARPGRAPKVYFTLFFATLSRAISTAVTVFNIVIFADGITESQTSIVHTIIAFTVLVNYFCFWSFALFFLSTCLLVRDRQLSLLKVSNSNMAPTAYYAFFALVMVFATVSATYYVVLQAKSYLDSGLTFEEGVRMENISMDLAYTFESLTYLASIFAAGYIIYAYQELRRLRSGDKVLLSLSHSENSYSTIFLQIIWTLLVTVVPFYLMYVVQGTIVTILTSSVGISLSGFNQTLRAEKMSLASAILTHLFLVCIGCTIVVLGLLRRPWHSGRRTRKFYTQKSSRLDLKS